MQKLIELINTIPSHKALNNSFYCKWVSGEIPIHHIAIFARNYLEFCLHFPAALAGLIINITNVPVRVEYTKILYSELGYGNSEKAHSYLFEKFCSDLSEKFGKTDYLSSENLSKNIPLLEKTKELIEGEKKLYSQSAAVGSGAQLALECQAYNMISLLYEGARNYAYLWGDQSKFHESCEFFYIHIGSAEKNHREESLRAIKKIVKNDELLQQAIYGFNAHLDLFANFWDALSAEMSS